MLLQLASEHQFSALVTVNQGFEYQKNVNTLPIPVVVMIAQTNRLQDLQSLVPDVMSILNSDPDTVASIVYMKHARSIQLTSNRPFQITVHMPTEFLLPVKDWPRFRYVRLEFRLQ